MHCCILLDFLCELYYDARIHEHQAVCLVFLQFTILLLYRFTFYSLKLLPESQGKS
jgi:hypothetical protein